MIFPDTIVISELMKPAPAAGVKRWFAGLAEEAAATTAVTLAELESFCRKVNDGLPLWAR